MAADRPTGHPALNPSYAYKVERTLQKKQTAIGRRERLLARRLGIPFVPSEELTVAAPWPSDPADSGLGPELRAALQGQRYVGDPAAPASGAAHPSLPTTPVGPQFAEREELADGTTGEHLDNQIDPADRAAVAGAAHHSREGTPKA